MGQSPALPGGVTRGVLLGAHRLAVRRVERKRQRGSGIRVAKCTRGTAQSVGAVLTGRVRTGMLKSMRCLNFAAVAAFVLAAPSEAQRVPGRDLLYYPIGTLAEAPSLALDTGDGFQNPAAIWLPSVGRIRGTAVALNTGTDRGVGGQLIAIAISVPDDITVGFSAVHASIDGIAPTVNDPAPIGREIPYNTLVLSLSGARRSLKHITSGIAVRYRTGEIGRTRGSAFGLDGGVIAEHVFGYDARIGLSSFLWGPGAGEGDDASLHTAFDARVIGADSTHQARVGYSYTFGDGAAAGHYVFISGRYSRWIGRAGIARTDAYGNTDTTLRLALGLRYARYTVGLSREDSAGGFDPTYQFVLSGVFR